MIDTHCHLTFDDYSGRVDGVVEAARAAGLRGMITVSTTAANCAETRALAERFPDVWCTAGVHPLYSDEPRDWPAVRAAGGHPRCVAWGELGLDNHYRKPPRALQDEVLAEQLAMIDADHGHLFDVRVVVDAVLDLERIDVLAAADDHVALA